VTGLSRRDPISTREEQLLLLPGSLVVVAHARGVIQTEVRLVGGDKSAKRRSEGFCHFWHLII
jgi:hypothetical protein